MRFLPREDGRIPGGGDGGRGRDRRGISSFSFSCVSMLGPDLGEGTDVCIIGHIVIGVLFLVVLVWEGGLLAITFLFVVFWDVVGSSDASTLQIVVVLGDVITL